MIQPPWDRVKIGDFVIYPPIGRRVRIINTDSYRVHVEDLVTLRQPDIEAGNRAWVERENFAPNWIIDESSTVKNILEKYQV